MSRNLRFGIVPGLHLALLACALPAAAQDGAVPTQRIEVSATRHDVRTLCPSIDAELHARLARSLHLLPQRALMDVQFQIDGRQISDVAAHGASFDAQAATRRAVRALGCDNGAAGRQKVRFEISYRLDDEREGAMAVVAPQSGQRVAAK